MHSRCHDRHPPPLICAPTAKLQASALLETAKFWGCNSPQLGIARNCIRISNSRRLREKLHAYVRSGRRAAGASRLFRVRPGIPASQSRLPAAIHRLGGTGRARPACAEMQGDGPNLGPELSRYVRTFAPKPIRRPGWRRSRLRSSCLPRRLQDVPESRLKRHCTDGRLCRTFRTERIGTWF